MLGLLELRDIYVQWIALLMQFWNFITQNNLYSMSEWIRENANNGPITAVIGFVVDIFLTILNSFGFGNMTVLQLILGGSFAFFVTFTILKFFADLFT